VEGDHNQIKKVIPQATNLCNHIVRLLMETSSTQRGELKSNYGEQSSSLQATSILCYQNVKSIEMIRAPELYKTQTKSFWTELGLSKSLT
jgi:hypothetical protein